MRNLPDYAVCVCLDDKEKFSGSIHSAILPEPIPFTGDADFIRKMNTGYDAIGRPQATALLRVYVGEVSEYTSFNRNPVHVRDMEEIDAQRGAEDTVDILMTSRRFAEWQGMILEQDGSMRGRFQTMTECMRMLKEKSE